MARPIPKVPPPRPPRATATALKPPPRATGATPKVTLGTPPARPAAVTQQDAAPVRYQAGDVIAGKYRLVSLLGEGGMGAVWRVRNMDLDVEVALKLIRSEATVSEATDRLLREAQAAAKLIDSGIVRVFDFGRSEQGNPFIVMELLEGEDLAAAIQRRGRLSPKRAVRVLLPVVRALSVAHQSGIVHRDLKPENVFLSKTPNGLQPKVVDFGIAQLDQSQALRLTSTGALMGSPLYMSPEQAKGETVDLRADIWGITAVLYEALTGTQAFAGSNYNAVLCAIMLREPERPAPEIGVDDELWSLIQRGLAKDPAFRYESMREFGQALAKWLIRCGEQTDITGASLATQWLSDGQPADQLTTVFPPSDVRMERDERNAPTQRLSRDPGLAAAASKRRPERPRRRLLVAAGALGGVVGALAVAWAAFGTGDAETPQSAEPARAAAPAPKPGQIRASEAAEAPKQPAPVPVPAELAEPTAAAEEAPEASASAPDPSTADTSASAKPATAPQKPRVRQATAHRPASGTRTSKLKNPFAQ